MKAFFDLQELENVLKDFYTVLRIRITIFDEAQNVIVSYPPDLPSYCKRIRRSENGRRGCMECDSNACQRAKSLGSAHIYTCHAGLKEAITPIIVEGRLLGYALLSHMSDSESFEETVETASRCNAVYGISKGETRELISQLSQTSIPTDTATIAAATNVLDAIVSYVSVKQLIRQRPEQIADQLEQYIIHHLSENLDCRTLCNHFHVSRSCLFKISKEHFGMGISQFIRKKQIQHAQKLLSSGCSVTDTALQCGFSDVSYFTKVFKSETNTLPHHLRWG